MAGTAERWWWPAPGRAPKRHIGSAKRCKGDTAQAHTLQPCTAQVALGEAEMLPGPFGPGSCFSVCTHGTCLTQGSEALLSDLEDGGGGTLKM